MIESNNNKGQMVGNVFVNYVFSEENNAWVATYPSPERDSTTPHYLRKSFLVSELGEEEAKSAVQKFYAEQLLKEYEDFFNHLISNGVPEYQAMEMLKELPDKNTEYLDNVNQGGMKAQLTFTTEWLHENTDWNNLGEGDKNGILYKLGMDTRKPHHTTTRLTQVGNTRVYTEVVYGDERMDKQWASTHNPHISEGVRDYLWYGRHGKGAMFG